MAHTSAGSCMRRRETPGGRSMSTTRQRACPIMIASGAPALNPCAASAATSPGAWSCPRVFHSTALMSGSARQYSTARPTRSRASAPSRFRYVTNPRPPGYVATRSGPSRVTCSAPSVSASVRSCSSYAASKATCSLMVIACRRRCFAGYRLSGAGHAPVASRSVHSAPAVNVAAVMVGSSPNWSGRESRRGDGGLQAELAASLTHRGPKGVAGPLHLRVRFRADLFGRGLVAGPGSMSLRRRLGVPKGRRQGLLCLTARLAVIARGRIAVLPGRHRLRYRQPLGTPAEDPAMLQRGIGRGDSRLTGEQNRRRGDHRRGGVSQGSHESIVARPARTSMGRRQA